MGSPYSGEIFHVTDEDEAKKAGLIPVRRDLSELERAMKQIMLYEVCMCGSGKKFKFCCYRGGGPPLPEQQK